MLTGTPAPSVKVPVSAKTGNRIIITAAITGAIHTPGLSDYLPITPAQIIEQAVGACEAGAAIVHIHGRNPKTGEPSQDLDILGEILSGIKARCDAICSVTTGGGLGMSPAQRVAVVPAFKPELASCTVGSFNYYLGPIADRLTSPKHPWEREYVASTADLVVNNTFQTITTFVETMYAVGTVPEFEVYDVGMVNNIAYLCDHGIIKKPVWIQFVTGVLGGLPATVPNICTMVQAAKELLGGDFLWSCTAAGRRQFVVLPSAMGLGGNVRVGLEDNLYLRPGMLAKNSAEQVTQLREIAERMGFSIASPAETRKILQLKGLGSVHF